nr:hypothetical protein [Vibrio parahaemolyticus]
MCTVPSEEVIKLDHLNHDYDNAELYRELVVCSNTLVNTKHILSADSGWHPLVIRKGIKPRVWLSIKIQENSDASKDSGYLELISDSQVKHSAVELTSTKYGFQITINDQIIVEAGNHTDEALEVIKLDLRPLGLNIYGDHTSLSVGNNSMSRNTSVNGHSMFGIN